MNGFLRILAMKATTIIPRYTQCFLIKTFNFNSESELTSEDSNSSMFVKSIGC